MVEGDLPEQLDDGFRRPHRRQRSCAFREYRFRPMPSSKEVRARQNRQKERVAAQRAERQRIRLRRRRLGGAIGVIVLVIVVLLGLTLGGGSHNNGVTVAPTSAEPSTTILASVNGKPCVGMKDPLPKSAPTFLLAPGPAPTKLTTQDIKAGTGAVVQKNAKVSVNYVGVACSTGKVFDTSFQAGRQPIEADLSPASTLIAGWKQGIPGMKIGGARLVSIPATLAYGASGTSGIAPGEALFFLVQAVKLG
jgi:peptidylprolyl isomerase